MNRIGKIRKRIKPVLLVLALCLGVALPAHADNQFTHPAAALNPNAFTNTYGHTPRPLYPYGNAEIPEKTYMPHYVAPPPPPPTYIDSNSGGYCRQYSQHVHTNNRVQESYGKACLQPDGNWRIMSQR